MMQNHKNLTAEDVLQAGDEQLTYSNGWVYVSEPLYGNKVSSFENTKFRRYCHESKQDVNAIQHGGTHYKTVPIQPWDYIAANNIGFFEGSAIKYLTRWKDKGGITDLKKAIHFIEKLISVEESKASPSEPKS